MIEVKYDSAMYEKIQATLPEYPVPQSPLITQISVRWGDLVTQVENGAPFTYSTMMEFYEGLADWLLIPTNLPPQEDWNKHNHDLLNFFESKGIHYHEELDKARKATVGYVMQLEIPINARLLLIDRITQIPVNVGGLKNRWKHMESGNSITVTPSRDIIDVNFTERAFWQRSSTQLIRAVIHRNFAHELGHEINNLTYSTTGKSVSSKYGTPHMDDFPVSYAGKDSDQTISGLRDFIMDERFAEHFGHAVPTEAGLPKTAIVDASRKNLASMYGLRINPKILIDVVGGILAALKQKGNVAPQQPAKKIEEYYYELLLPNKPMALALPFTQQAVESMLTEAWQDSEEIRVSQPSSRD